MVLFFLEIPKVKKEYDNRLISQFPNAKNSNEIPLEVRIFILQKNASTENLLDKEIVFNNSILSNSNTLNISFIVNNSFFNASNNSDLQSTINDSKSPLNVQHSTMEKPKEYKFNSLRSNFYLKNLLYDIQLHEDFNNLKIPTKYIIEGEYFGFLYYNDLTTFCISISGFIKNSHKSQHLLSDETIDKECNDDYGLYFCKKNIEIESASEITSKKCSPNEFMCKNCMEKNKKMYNIKKKYLININGRVAKINKGSYHCFGHFLCGNQIEDCITKFTCEACKMLNLYSNYFNQNQ